jgi:hypothetical protein
VGITLGEVIFNEAYTTVREKFAEIGGRDARIIVISGVIFGESALQDIETLLDAVAAAASEDGCVAALSLRTGRRLMVRRTAFSREAGRDSLVGAFVLELAADDPLEESSALTSVNWTITESGATRLVTSSGTAETPTTITFVASGGVVNPSFSDGSRTARYEGTVADGQTLILDGVQERALLAGEDVTPYVSGVFPQVAPGDTTLTYEDDASSSHSGTATVAFRDRWY